MKKPLPSTIPATPGVYLYKDDQGRIIYVGKAKNLRKRVLSYFREGAGLSTKTQAMLNRVSSVETLATTTEKEAFLLEASLIKKHHPHYNIILRDDKDYVLFRLDTAKQYPRLEVVRRVRAGQEKASTLLFGPFSSSGSAKETWKAIHHAFPLRRCTDSVFKNRARPCLYHYMRQCLAPCVLPVDSAAYAEMVHQVALLLAGRSRELLKGLKAQMQAAADALDFEHAAMLRDRIAAVERTIERQAVVLTSDQDLDALGLAAVEGGLALGMLFVRQGKLLDKRTFFWPGLDLDDGTELLETVLVQFYQTGVPVPQRIIAPWMSREALRTLDSPVPLPRTVPAFSQGWKEQAEAGQRLMVLEAVLSEIRGGPVRLSGPRNAAEDALISLAATNAREASHPRGPDLSGLLAACFDLHEPVERIEAVDVSHTGGTAGRVGMVVFNGGQPAPEAYRTYAVDANGDDYAALRQWAQRRAAAGPPWPDLVLVDGGKGQLNAVVKTFAESGIAGRFALAGIAKPRDETGRADRSAGAEDRIFVPGRSNPLPVRSGSPELFFLQYVRDTVHEYVLGRHRRVRKNQALAGELLRIPGVGPKIARLLWDRFGSLAGMAAASEDDLARIDGIGAARAAALRRHLSLLSAPAAVGRKGENSQA